MGTLLSVQEVASRLLVHDTTILRMLHRGEFPNAFKAGRAWRIPEVDLDGYVEKQRRERQTATPTSES